ncbi:MAG: hypothetical protein ACYTFY_07665, partial [Planctomycetota bacterium]
KNEALESLIFNVYYSPREHAYLRAFLTRINQKEGQDNAFTYLGRVKTVDDAIYRFCETEMHWSVHDQYSKIKKWLPLENNMAVLNDKNELLVILAWDKAAVTDEVKAIFAQTKKVAEKEAATPVVWIAGDADTALLKKAEKSGIELRIQGRINPAFAGAGHSMWPHKMNKKELSEHKKLKLAQKAKDIEKSVSDKNLQESGKTAEVPAVKPEEAKPADSETKKDETSQEKSVQEKTEKSKPVTEAEKKPAGNAKVPLGA